MGIIGDTKEVVGLVKAMGNADLYQKIIDLQGEIIELSQENLELRTENQKLKDVAAFQARITFRNGVFWATDDPAPFCPRCWESDSKQVHLHFLDGSKRWTCKNCDKVFH